MTLRFTAKDLVTLDYKRIYTDNDHIGKWFKQNKLTVEVALRDILWVSYGLTNGYFTDVKRIFLLFQCIYPHICLFGFLMNSTLFILTYTFMKAIDYLEDVKRVLL